MGARMPSLPFKLLLSAVGLAVVLAGMAPADAKDRKHKRQVVAQKTVRVQPAYRGTNLYPAGPIYNGPDYLGDDPDPFIRSQIYRDLGAHYGDAD